MSKLNFDPFLHKLRAFFFFPHTPLKTTDELTRSELFFDYIHQLLSIRKVAAAAARQRREREKKKNYLFISKKKEICDEESFFFFYHTPTFCFSLSASNL
jgi:hypothetical protein